MLQEFTLEPKVVRGLFVLPFASTKRGPMPNLATSRRVLQSEALVELLEEKGVLALQEVLNGCSGSRQRWWGGAGCTSAALGLVLFRNNRMPTDTAQLGTMAVVQYLGSAKCRRTTGENSGLISGWRRRHFQLPKTRWDRSRAGGILGERLGTSVAFRALRALNPGNGRNGVLASGQLPLSLRERFRSLAKNRGSGPTGFWR